MLGCVYLEKKAGGRLPSSFLLWGQHTGITMQDSWLHSPSKDWLLKECYFQYCTRAQILCYDLDINPTKRDGY